MADNGNTLAVGPLHLLRSVAGHGLQLSDWSWVGPFAIPDSRDLGKVFATPFAAESEPFDLSKPMGPGALRWVVQPQWEDGTVNRLGTAGFAAYYVTRTITASAPP